MKKFFLLFASCAMAMGANAQFAPTSVVRMEDAQVTDGAMGVKPTGVTITADMMKALRASKNQAGTANKGTLNGSRWYNYVDHLAILNPTVFDNDNYPYMWNKPNIYGMYVDASSNPVRDTITMLSVGTVLHPYWSEYNDPAAYAPLSFGVNGFTNYNVDSVSVYGTYGRNPQKPNVVDTLTFALTYGNGGTTNIPIYYFTGMQSKYNVDTLRTALLLHDSVNNVATKSATGPAVLYKRVYLTAASLADTINGGLHRFSIASPGFAVPAGNLVGVSVTFKTGDTYVPFADTAFRGTNVNPTIPYKFGMFRPLIYEELAGQFSTYKVGNYNSGQFKNWPFTNYEGLYVPHWAFSNATSTLEFPYIDIKISSTSGIRLGVSNTGTIAKVDAYPNPANNTLSIPVTLKADGNISITITNMMGQVMKTENLGNAGANQTKTATFNVSDLASGIYLYTVEAKGERITNRVVIAH